MEAAFNFNNDEESSMDILTWMKLVEFPKSKNYKECWGVFKRKAARKLGLKVVEKWDQAEALLLLAKKAYQKRLYGRCPSNDASKVVPIQSDIEYLAEAIALVPSEAKFYFERARSHFVHQSNYHQALLDLSRVIELSPSSVSYAARAAVNEKLGYYSKAFRDYSRALRVSQADNQAWLYEASMERIVELLKKAPKGKNENRICLLYYPNDPVYYHNLGDLYLQEENYALALTNYQKAKTLDPRSTQYYDSWENAQEHCEAFNWNNLGREYFEKGDITHAIEAFEKALAVMPKKALFLNNLGMCHFVNHEDDLAIHYCAKAVESSPNAQRYHNLGRAYFRKANYASAEDYYRRALSLEPENNEYRRCYKVAAKAAEESTMQFRRSQEQKKLADYLKDDV